MLLVLLKGLIVIVLSRRDERGRRTGVGGGMGWDGMASRRFWIGHEMRLRSRNGRAGAAAATGSRGRPRVVGVTAGRAARMPCHAASRMPSPDAPHARAHRPPY